MLTFSSDSLPQIVCPMDEDVIPSNPFCSAPPHTELPPPLFSLSSITPSCVNDGISGNRRSGRIQSIRAQTPKKHDDTIDIRETPKPSRQNPSPTRRHRESGNMVQVSQSKQPRVEVNHEQEKYNEDELDFNFAADRCQSKQIDQKTSDVSSSAAADVVEPENDDDGDDAEILYGVKSDMDADASVENSSASKGWVIGPLFQSFKSKMASFTEIVMSPVKLFRANSPPLSMDQTEKLTVTDETNDAFQTIGDEKQEVEVDLQRIDEVEEAENTKPSAFKYCKRISFDTEMSTPSCEPADECAITQKEKNSPDPVVPFLDDSLTCVVSKQISESIESVISSSCVGLSASQSERAVRVKAPPRKRTGNRSELKRSVSKPLTSELRQKESEICQTNSVQLDSKQTDLFSSSVCFTPPDGAGDGLVRQSIWNNVNNCVNRKTVDAQHLENRFNSDAPAVGPVRPKRGLKVSCQTQEVAKRKKVTATGDLSTDETKNPESLIITSLRGKTRKELTTTKTIEEKEETVKPLRKRQTGSTRANRKGKVGQEMFPTINESVLNSSPDPMLVCSLDQNNVVSENKQKNCSGSKTKQTASNKRLKTKPDLRKPDVNIDSMDLETTLAITSTKRDEEEPLNDVLVRPSNNKNVNKKPLKRKSPTMNSESTLVSTSSVLLTQPEEFNSSTSAQGEENLKPGLNQTSKKRSRKGLRAAVKSHDAQDTNLHPTKENKQTDPVYFEMTPFESKHQPVPAPSQPHLECYVQLNNEVKQLIDNKMTMSAPEIDDVFPPDADNQSSVTASKLRSRRVGAKACRADKQRRRCRVLHQATHEGEEVTNSVTMEDADLSASGCRSSENKISRRLLRSYSCPEIPSLRLHDAPWTPPFHSPHHNRTHLSHQHHSSHAPLVPQVHKSPRRARRHTVCSVEVEREIAPLCLRKEIYPTRRSAPHDGVAHFSPGVALSPSASLTALASCFLSSPLAFLSKKVDIRAAASSPSASNHVSSSSPLTSPSSSSSWQLPGFLQRNDSSRGTSDSSSSVNPLVCKIERRRQREEEDDGEDTSSSSQEFEDVALREEKALSDSEIKVVQKHEERGKVSSIRIRKTLPKPQNNLTPMGLPKPIRLKKKEFSLEEIYTNKNFSKPPESRLETIFEVPLNRRNGSESWFGQRRVKRFLEFLEVGEVRKPKKPLVGVGKASINSSSRTRRGSFTKDEALLNVQDVDSLLCAKLDQLNLWLIHDQTES